jgi:NOL1/NOP2/fmu family ribosome biogenesis protein
MVVSCESPDVLSKALPEFFDKILLDAPCSGEGMFRKDQEAVRHWTPEHVISCALRQQKILESAAAMLKGGGLLVYSTCTFSPEENEYSILNFLDRHPDFALDHLPKLHPDFVESPILPGTMRLYPHRINGEGHFIARLVRKTSSVITDNKVISDHNRENNSSVHKNNKNRFSGNNQNHSSVCLPINRSEIFADLQSLLNNYDAGLLSAAQGGLLLTDQSSLISHEGHFWLDPLDGRTLPKINILSRGLYLGQKKPGRFLPGHALAHALKPDQFKEYLSFLPTESSLEAYLHGEEISSPGQDGWAAIGVDSFPLGWGRRSNGRFKNHYPKNLRQ